MKRAAACSSCGIRYPLARKWSDDYGGGLTPTSYVLGEACAREGCAGRIGFPVHVSARFDALRELWGKRETSLRRQAERASSHLAVGLHAHASGMADGMKLAALELEREQWGQVQELAPLEVFPFPDLEIDRRAAELRAATLNVWHLLKCERQPEVTPPPTVDTTTDPVTRCTCNVCKLAWALFGDPLASPPEETHHRGMNIVAEMQAREVERETEELAARRELNDWINSGPLRTARIELHNADRKLRGTTLCAVHLALEAQAVAQRGPQNSPEGSMASARLVVSAEGETLAAAWLVAQEAMHILDDS